MYSKAIYVPLKPKFVKTKQKTQTQMQNSTCFSLMYSKAIYVPLKPKFVKTKQKTRTQMQNTTACIKHAVFWKKEKELILENYICF